MGLGDRDTCEVPSSCAHHSCGEPGATAMASGKCGRLFHTAEFVLCTAAEDPCSAPVCLAHTIPEMLLRLWPCAWDSWVSCSQSTIR